MKITCPTLAAPVLAAAFLSFSLAAVAGQQAFHPEQRSLPGQLGPDVSSTLLCAHPFENHGSYQLSGNVTGAGVSSDSIPAGKFLEIRYVKATLKGAAPVAGDIGLVFGGRFGWHHMRVRQGAVEYNASRDDALYADGNTRIKFVAYRGHGPDVDQAVSGDYIMRGCIVDSLPAITRKPPIEVPYIPSKRLERSDPIEFKQPAKIKPLRQGG